jgi:hypothetical protein
VAEIAQGVQAFIYLEYNIAAPAAVSPVGAAGRDVFFPMKGHSPVSAFAGVNGNADLIRKVSRHRRSSFAFISSRLRNNRFAIKKRPDALSGLSMVTYCAISS